MAQQSMLSAPASRQDIVSALLNDYGNSFGRGDASPSTWSPVPADKKLPAPPSRSDSGAREPLPAALRMEAKFQLRGKQRSHKFYYNGLHPCLVIHQELAGTDCVSYCNLDSACQCAVCVVIHHRCFVVAQRAAWTKPSYHKPERMVLTENR